MVQVVPASDQQPSACQWIFTFDVLPAVCSYQQRQTVNIILFGQDGSLLQLVIETSDPKGCLFDPRKSTERIQYPLSQILPGKAQLH
jgi:hypothetical protein